ncbi:MAG: SRPBCC family protein [Thaumarchaeota archaeon]|nr:MAG: SRPBCC family protein [Nitrososphaerota archaeon]TLX95992.1 MAG: SRPBCC family protein [Nitrososphaerota archaeon]
MVQIQASVEINAPLDKVWNIISDLDSEPKFWKGTKEIRNISREGNIVNREITIAFKDSKCMQTVTVYPKEKIHAEFTKGIINGTKTITVIRSGDKTRIDAGWDIKLSGMMGMFTGMVKKHIQNGTEQALRSIKQEAER